jgi:hypothetical protein
MLIHQWETRVLPLAAAIQTGAAGVGSAQGT